MYSTWKELSIFGKHMSNPIRGYWIVQLCLKQKDE